MIIDLPYPPSSNRYWRNVNGRMIVSEDARQYKRAVGLIANLADLQPIRQPSAVAIFLWIRRPAQRRDLDNHLKVTLDSLQGYLYENDSQIVSLSVTMTDDKKNPGVTVECVSAH